MLNSSTRSVKVPTKFSASLNKDSIQLPSINKTVPTRDTKADSQEDSRSFLKKKIQLLTKNVDYEIMTDAEVQIEYKKLRDTLKQLNSEIAKLLDRVQLTHLKHNTQQNTAEVLEIRNRQKDNNEKILQFYKRQYSKLKKRHESVHEDFKQDLDKEVRQIKQKYQTTKKQIVNIKKSNVDRGNDIIDGDSLFREWKKLSAERTAAQQKKNKIEEQYKRVIEENTQCLTKTTLLLEVFEKAEKVLRDCEQTQNQQRNSKKLQMNLLQKKANLEGAKKKLQSQHNSGQQKYLLKLKQLESTVSTISSYTAKINTAESQIIQLKNTVADLENKYKNRMNVTNFEDQPGRQSQFTNYTQNNQNQYATEIKKTTSKPTMKVRSSSKELGKIFEQEVQQQRPIKVLETGSQFD